MRKNNLKRIVIIEGDYARDTQIFYGDPDIIEKDPNWWEHFFDAKYPNLYVGIYEDTSEKEIRDKASADLGVHPNTISLIDIEDMTFIDPETDESVCPVREADEVCGTGVQNLSNTALDADIFAFKRLRAHVGHNIEAVTYGNGWNVSIECTDCNEVLYSVDNPDANPKQQIESGRREYL